jgi:hypothetical protein
MGEPERARARAVEQEGGDQRPAALRAQDAPDLGAERRALGVENVGEERLREDEIGARGLDRQPLAPARGRGGVRAGAEREREAEARIARGPLPASVERRLVDVEAEVASSGTEPALEDRDHRARAAAEIDDRGVRTEEVEGGEPALAVERRGDERAERPGVAPEPERRERARLRPERALEGTRRGEEQRARRAQGAERRRRQVG